jgi:SAM-dependent methyltransferase
MAVSKWPKRVPELTAEQQRIRDDFMRYWQEVLPRRYGAIERFNHGWPAATARRGERTLELGAGLGEHLDSEPDFAKEDYVAVELRAEMAESIRRRDGRVEVLVADCQRRLPFEDNSFDRILAIHVLEHLPDLPSALREVARLLRPAGRFVVVIPCEGGFAYGLARRISAERIFKRRYRMSYRWFVESEHINRPAEIVDECERLFDLKRRSYFPLRIPVQTLNLAIGLEFARPARGSSIPFQPAIGRNDPPKRVDVGVLELRRPAGKAFPCVPGRADQPPGDPVAGGGSEEDAQRRPALERCPAALALLQRALVERRTDPFPARLENLCEQSGVERAGRDRVHIDSVVTNLLGERLREAHDGCFRRRVRA